MEQMTESYKKRLTGRKPKLNPCTHCVMVRLEKATKEITALAKDVISLAHTTRRINFTSDDYV